MKKQKQKKKYPKTERNIKKYRNYFLQLESNFIKLFHLTCVGALSNSKKDGVHK